MKLFSTFGKKRLPGHKKESAHSPLLTLDIQKVEYVYFPLVAGNGAPIQSLVKLGDKVKKGTKIAFKEQFSVPYFSSVSGTVVGIEKRINGPTGKPVDHLVIKNDFKEIKDKPLKTVTLDDSPTDIVNAIRDAGIVGLGGAAFPTWVKYNNVVGIETLVINAVECEPYLTTDFTTSRLYAEKIIEGALFLKKASGAKNVIIALKENKPEAYTAFTMCAIKHLADVEIREVPDRYPMGWEATLIYQLFKKRYNRLPSEIGLIVNNSTTALAVYDALVLGEPITNRFVTVSGNVVNNPANINVPVGTLASVVLNEFDINKDKEFTLLAGGPMTSNAALSADFALQPATGGLTLLEKVHLRTIPCLRCGTCSAHCPAGLQPVEIMRAFESKDYVRLEKLDTSRCVDCGLCSYVCPSNIELTEFMKQAKALLRANPVAGKK